MCNAPELTLAKLDAWLAMADVDSEFEAVVAPRHNTIVQYVLWQVSLKMYPAATILTDGQDYRNGETLPWSRTTTSIGRAAPYQQMSRLTHTRSRPMEIGSSTSTRCSRPARSRGRFYFYGA